MMQGLCYCNGETTEVRNVEEGAKKASDMVVVEVRRLAVRLR